MCSVLTRYREVCVQCLLGISERNFMLNGLRVWVLTLNLPEGAGLKLNAYSV